MIESVLSVSSEPGYIWLRDQIHFKQPLITELLKMEDNFDAQVLMMILILVRREGIFNQFWMMTWSLLNR